MRAIPPAHQNAILGIAQIGEGHGEPDAGPRQCRRKGYGSGIRDHTMTIVVRTFGRPFLTGQIGCKLAGRGGRRGPCLCARAEFQHAMFAVGHERQVQISKGILSPPHNYIFGKEGCKQLAEEMNVPLLAQIPLVQSICDNGDAGTPAALSSETATGLAFINLAQAVVTVVNRRNKEQPETKIVGMNS